jgi:sulfatase maturation enzyme AslB (radical SAM superfamily)
VNPQHLIKICKRPPCSFLIWCKAGARKKAIAENPLMNSRDIGCLLGRMWASLSAEEKKPFKDQHDKELLEFQKANPDSRHAGGRPRKHH